MPPLDLTYAPAELREKRLREAASFVQRPEPFSPAQRDALLGPEHVERILEAAGPNGWPRLLRDWRYWARPTQLEPIGRHIIWMLLCGRGWGKSRTGLEWLREGIDAGDANPFGLVAPTRKDVFERLVYGDEGAPGLVRTYDYLPDALRPQVNKNEGRIYFPHNGTEGFVYTAEKPEIRGPNMRRWLCDEFAQWPYLRECWDNIEMTTRARGKKPPKICITTTPRPLALIKELLDDPAVAVTFGSTFANSANLAPTWVRRMLKKYQGSRLGLQELMGLVLGDNPDAMFKQDAIDASRVTAPPAIVQIVVAVDPAIATGRRNDLTGLVVVGLGSDRHLYVLRDLTGVELDTRQSGLVVWLPEEPKHHTPEQWGELVVRAVRYFGSKYDCPVRVVGERNRGGDLVRSNVLQTDKLKGGAGAIPYQEVQAIRAKGPRAEEVSVLYAQARIHHVGQLPALETEMVEWVPQLTRTSPNRIDALVWAAFGLMPELATGEAPTDRAEEAKRIFSGFAEAQKAMPGSVWSSPSGGKSDDYDRV